MTNKKNKTIRIFAWFGAIVFAVVLAVMPFFVNNRNNIVTYADSIGDSYRFESAYLMEDIACTRLDTGATTTGTTQYLRANSYFAFGHSTNGFDTAGTSKNYYLKFKFGSLRPFAVVDSNARVSRICAGTYLTSSTNNYKLFANYSGLAYDWVLHGLGVYQNNTYGGYTPYTSTQSYGSYYYGDIYFNVENDFEFVMPYFYDTVTGWNDNGTYRERIAYYQFSICVRGTANFVTPRYLVKSYDVFYYFGVNNTFGFYCNSYKFYDENNNYVEILIPHDIVSNLNVSTSSTYYFYDSASDSEYYGQGYSDGYNDGKSDGDFIGYQRGYDSGYSVGERAGYNQGLTNNDYTFLGLFGAIVDAPLSAFTGLFDFNLSFDGVHNFNLKGFFLAILTISLVIAIIRFAMSR